MRKLLLSLFVVLSGLSLCLQGASAAPKKDFISQSEYNALRAAHPELKAAEDEMERVLYETFAIIGNEGGSQWLGDKQSRWEGEKKRKALSKGDLESPELVQSLIDSAHERIVELHKIAAEGRVIERQIYISGMERHLEIWKYAGNQVKSVSLDFSGKRLSQVQLSLPDDPEYRRYVVDHHSRFPERYRPCRKQCRWV